MCARFDFQNTFRMYILQNYRKTGHRIETARAGVAVIHITFMTLQDTILYTLSDSSSSHINGFSIKLV